MENVFVILDDNNVVENIIVCESLELARELTGKVCMPQRDDNPATVGGIYNQEVDAFQGPKPYPSWVWNNVGKFWEAPVLRDNPDGYAYWNEEELRWVEVERPEE